MAKSTKFVSKVTPNVHATMAKLATTLGKKAEGVTKIKTQAEYDAVANVVKQITEAEKQVKIQKGKEVDPIKQGLKEIESRYREWENKLASAKMELKSFMVTWINTCWNSLSGTMLLPTLLPTGSGVSSPLWP